MLFIQQYKFEFSIHDLCPTAMQAARVSACIDFRMQILQTQLGQGYPV
jgi:hypothetical protein